MDNILKSDYLLYYLAFIVGAVGFVMCIIFIPFKSVATLMMMISGVGVVLFSMFLLVLALLLDAHSGKFTF
ncbi:MAG: hypothetical protein P1P69_06675 [Methanosarcinaceae archaeon]|nr:hypothetical protein [Methanosarcinaceae archaeon]MDF1534169.1 hypothetical protein [Methanosarcinaceae archaeon]MDO9516854.1 hypothetical protein [Methanosarcinaceae archaeon]